MIELYLTLVVDGSGVGRRKEGVPIPKAMSPKLVSCRSQWFDHRLSNVFESKIPSIYLFISYIDSKE